MIVLKSTFTGELWEALECKIDSHVEDCVVLTSMSREMTIHMLKMGRGWEIVEVGEPVPGMMLS